LSLVSFVSGLSVVCFSIESSDLYPDGVPCISALYPPAVYLGRVSWPCILAVYPGRVSWPCILAVYPGLRYGRG